jgi:hypothetical protein
MARVGAEDRQRLVADLPAVAVGAVEHAPPPQRRQPVDRGQLVDDAGGQQQPPCLLAATVGQRDREAVAVDAGRRHLCRSQLDAVVGGELLRADPVQLARRQPVAAEEPVHVGNRRVAGRPRVAQQHPPPCASQQQRAIEPGRAATHDHDLEHQHLLPSDSGMHRVGGPPQYCSIARATHLP